MDTSVPSKNKLVPPDDSDKEGRARANRAAAHGGADRVCVPCPPALTGGESQNKDEDEVKVDWCTVTWKPEPDEVLGLNIHALLIRLMGDVVGAEVPGMLGYATGFKFYQLSYGSLISVGRLDYGGECHQGRARTDLSGTGCAQVGNWLLLQSEIAAFPAVKLTRVDLAYDSIDGAFGVEDAFDWYLQGEFNAGGRNPRYSTPGIGATRLMQQAKASAMAAHSKLADVRTARCCARTKKGDNWATRPVPGHGLRSRSAT